MSNKLYKFEQISNIYMCKGDFKFTHIHIYINAGSNHELEGKNGLAHLVEHMKLSHNLKSEKNNIEYKSMGYTNLNHTVLKYCLINDEYTKKNIELLLANVLDGNEYNINKFNDCREEVIKECVYYKEKIKQQQEIYRFITNAEVNNMTVGNIKDLMELSLVDINHFITKWYHKDNISILIATKIETKEIQNLIVPYISKKILNKSSNYSPKNKHRQIKYKYLHTSECENTKIELYYRNYMNIIALEDVIYKAIFELLIRKKIIELGNLEGNIMENYISKTKKFYYIIMKVIEGKTTNFEIENIIYEIEKTSFTQKDLDEASECLKASLYPLKCNDLEYISNNLLYNFMYQEPLRINIESINRMKKIISDLTISEMNQYARLVFENNLNVVITSRI